MLSILNQLTFQNKFQNVVTNNVFLDKNNNNKTKNQTAGNWNRDLCVTSAPPIQLRVPIALKLFNFFEWVET